MNTMSNRPTEVLNNWLARHGYDTRRSTDESRPALSYAMLVENEGGVTRERWISLAVADSPDQVCLEGFRTLHAKYQEWGKQGLYGDAIPTVKALLVVAHGKAEIAAGIPGGGGPMDFDKLPKEVRRSIEAEYPEVVERIKAGPVPTRAVTVITEEGTASDVTMFYPHMSEPLVEVHEQWTGDPDRDNPEMIVKDALTSVLHKMMTFTVLTVRCIRAGRGLDIEDMSETAMENIHEPFGRAGLALMMNMMAFGVENNLFDLEEGGD